MMKVFGAALEYLRGRFKGDLGHREEDFTVGTAVIEVAHGDAERVSLTFVNLGATTLYIAPSINVSAAWGMRLAANGGTVSMNVVDDSLLPALNWRAMGSAPAGVLYVLSVRRSSIRTEAE